MLVGVSLVPTSAAAGGDRQARDAARGARQRRENDDRSTRAAAATAVLSADTSGCAVGTNRPRAGEAAGANQNHATAGTTARRAERVVVAAGTTAAAEEDPARGSRHDGTTVTTACKVGRPGVAALSAGTRVAASAAA